MEAQKTPVSRPCELGAFGHSSLESWLVALAEGEQMGKNGQQAKRSAVSVLDLPHRLMYRSLSYTAKLMWWQHVKLGVV